MMAFSRSLTVTPGEGAPQTPQIRELKQQVAPPDQALLGGKRHMARIEERGFWMEIKGKRARSSGNRVEIHWKSSGNALGMDVSKGISSARDGVRKL